ncbi:MAG: hypothetical protein OXT01_25410 [Rhodospirillaceae bacterium]|nr:hypothetical protein [Rhodospirillaceae bacterium]
MTYWTTDKESAEAQAARLSEALTGVEFEKDKIYTRFVVQPYPDGSSFGGIARDVDGDITWAAKWGVIGKWIYRDRPDLPEFGGAFMPLDKAYAEDQSGCATANGGTGDIQAYPLPDGLEQPDIPRPLAPNCGPLALAIAIGVPVEEMMDLYRHTFKFGPRWRGKTHLGQHRTILNILGVKWRYHYGKSRGSLGKWFENHGVPGRVYLIRTGNHFQVVREGWRCDQNGWMPLWSERCKNNRVTHVYEIFI